MGGLRYNGRNYFSTGVAGLFTLLGISLIGYLAVNAVSNVLEMRNVSSETNYLNYHFKDIKILPLKQFLKEIDLQVSSDSATFSNL